MNKKILIMSIIIWVFLCLYFLLVRINEPILGWQLVDWSIAKTIAVDGPEAVNLYRHQPFFTGLMALFLKVFGISEAYARLVGVSCFFLILVFIYLIVKELSDEKDIFPVFLCAGLVFSINPITIQGSLVIDRADTSLFSLLLCVFYFFLIKTENKSLLIRTLILGFFYSLCLSAKMTTSLACVIAIPLTYLFKKDFKYGLKLTLNIFLIGVMLFLGYWALFCLFKIGLDRFWEPFYYYSAESKQISKIFTLTKLKSVVIDIFRLWLWFSPSIVVLCFFATLCKLKNCLNHKVFISLKELHLIIFILIVLGGYLTITATVGGFPKYVFPTFPLVCCLLGKFIWLQVKECLNTKTSFYSFLIITCGVFYYFYFVRDWIYSIYLLREAALAENLGIIYYGIINNQFLYFVFPLTVLAISYFVFQCSLYKRIIYSLFVSFVASSISLNYMQSNAAYSVNYSYGAEGIKELKRFYQNKKELAIYAPQEAFMSNVERNRFHNIPVYVRNDSTKLLKFLIKKRAECVISGIAVNTVSQLNNVMKNPQLKSYFKKYYNFYKIGSYNVLLFESQ